MSHLYLGFFSVFPLIDSSALLFYKFFGPNLFRGLFCLYAYILLCFSIASIFFFFLYYHLPSIDFI